jgi:hypothetical protein
MEEKDSERIIEILKYKINQHKKKKAQNKEILLQKNKEVKPINCLHLYIYFHLLCFIISIWLYFRCNTTLNPLNLLSALLFSPIYIIYMVLQPNFKERCNL